MSKNRIEIIGNASTGNYRLLVNGHDISDMVADVKTQTVSEETGSYTTVTVSLVGDVYFGGADKSSLPAKGSFVLDPDLIRLSKAQESDVRQIIHDALKEVTRA